MPPWFDSFGWQTISILSQEAFFVYLRIATSFLFPLHSEGLLTKNGGSCKTARSSILLNQPYAPINPSLSSGRSTTYSSSISSGTKGVGGIVGTGADTGGVVAGGAISAVGVDSAEGLIVSDSAETCRESVGATGSSAEFSCWTGAAGERKKRSAITAARISNNTIRKTVFFILNPPTLQIYKPQSLISFCLFSMASFFAYGSINSSVPCFRL